MHSWECNRKDAGLDAPAVGELPLGQCSNEQSESAAYWYNTPGNLGYQREQNSIPPYFIVTMMLFMVILFAGPHISRLQEAQVAQIDAETICPNDYALQIQGLPKDAVDEREIKEFATKHFCDTPVDVVKVVLAFNIYEIHQLEKKLKSVAQSRANAMMLLGKAPDSEKVEEQKCLQNFKILDKIHDFQSNFIQQLNFSSDSLSKFKNFVLG